MLTTFIKCGMTVSQTVPLSSVSST